MGVYHRAGIVTWGSAVYSDLEIMGDLDELRKQARQYLLDAQKTPDQLLREELIKLCEKMLHDAAAVRQAIREEG